MKTWIVRALVGLYPGDWRREYGTEIADMLMARPLTPLALGDLLRNALWQRVSSAEPAMLAGFVMMLMVLLQHPLHSSLYVLALFGCGVWTSLRHGGDASKSARTAVYVSMLAGIPVMVSGAMMWAGAARAPLFGSVVAEQTCWLRVSTPTPLWEALRSAACAPAPLGLLISPLFLLPQAWLWGTLGGRLGRWARQSF